MWFEVRTRRQIAAVALSAVCCFGAPAGCGGGGDDDNVAVPGGFATGDDRVVCAGAAELDDAGARLRWSSAALRFRFVGRARILIDDAVATGDLACEDGGNRLLLTTTSDDGRARARRVRGDVVVEAATPTTVSLLKETEALFGAVRVLAVVIEDGVIEDGVIEDGAIEDGADADGVVGVVEGGASEDARRTVGALLPPPPAAPTVLVLGDSFSTGFGVLGDVPDAAGRRAGPSCAPTPDNMAISKAWPLVVDLGPARDVAVVGWSGRGVVRDYAGDTAPLTVPELWSTTTLARAPDDVVIALGGNDYAAGAPDAAAFRAAWRALLDDDLPPRRLVLLPDAGDAPPQQPLRADDFAGPGVVVVEGVPPIRTGEGCLWHPGTQAHAAYAQALAPRLRPLLKGHTPAR